jgi:hypothetical protein
MRDSPIQRKLRDNLREEVEEHRGIEENKLNPPEKRNINDYDSDPEEEKILDQDTEEPSDELKILDSDMKGTDDENKILDNENVKNRTHSDEEDFKI